VVQLQKPDSVPVLAPTTPVAIGDIVDTVGAGDVFIAGIMGQRIFYSDHDVPLQELLEKANDLCGRKICQEGFCNLKL